MEFLTEIFTWATGFIDSLTALVTDSPITYLIILAMAAIDVLVMVLPAEATVTAAAVLAGQGSLNIIWIMLAAGLGAFIGDNVAYWIGRAAGRPLVERILGDRTEQLDNVQEQFDRRGGLFIIIGRFIPGGRTVIAVGAGVVHFGWLQFMIYDAIAAVIWAFQAALPGFIGGALIQDKAWLALIFGFVLSGLMAGGIALGQHWWERRKRGKEEAAIDAVSGVGAIEDESADPAAEREAFSRRVVSRVSGIPEQTIEEHEHPAEAGSKQSEPRSDAAPEADAQAD